MNVNLLFTKGIVRELRNINTTLSRLADCWETELAQQGLFMRPPKADKSGPPDEIFYVDEEENAVRELEERLGRAKKAVEEEPVE